MWTSGSWNLLNLRLYSLYIPEQCTPRYVRYRFIFSTSVFYYLKSKAALCFFCLLTNIEPSHKYQPQSRVQLVGLWLWDCLWAVRWSSAGQTSQIYHKYSDFYFFTAPWISDNGSDWICTDRKEVVKKSYWESKLKQMKIYCISVFFLLCVIETVEYLFFVCRSSHEHLPPPLPPLPWKTRIAVFFFFVVMACSGNTSVCIAYCWNKKLR